MVSKVMSVIMLYCLLSLTATAQEAYEKNPDDTHRLMYVGSTRSKKTLHLIYPESKGGYEL